MRRASYGFIIILLFFSLPLAVFSEGYIDVTVEEGKAMIDSNPSLVVLDVRAQSEYDSGHLRNAKLIPHTELESRLGELNVNDHILVYCKLGGRSAIASQILVDNGFTDVYNMLGGITDWLSYGYPVYVKYTSIQQAINDASIGDEILISSGVYVENVVVNKTVLLMGENREGTIVNASIPTEPVFNITANHVVLRGLRISSSSQSDYGIYMRWREYVNIIDCEISSTTLGIFLQSSHNNLLTNCTISNNEKGVRINTGGGNTIENLEVHSNEDYGISTYHTSNTIISNCNTSMNRGPGINIYSSTTITIVGSISALNEDSYAGRGIRIYGSSYCNITKNQAFSNEGYGIFFDQNSTNNLVKENQITSNTYGIHLESSSSNTLFHNNLINNTVQVNSINSTNIWDDGYPSGGNYWDNYNGTDIQSGQSQNETGSDGLGDTPSLIDGNNTDHYPLMQPYYGTVRNLNSGSSYPSIQEAMDNANPSDRIYAFAGIYCEHLVVNKSLSIIGEHSNSTLIDGNAFGNTLRIIENNVNISQFTIRNAYNGISLENITRCIIDDNIITTNQGYGMTGKGENITIKDNTITKNGKGINLTLTNSAVHNNTIFHNNFLNHSIQQTSSLFENIWDNRCEGNYWSDYNGSDVDGDGIGDTPYVIDVNNTDHYPLMNPYWNPADINHDQEVDIFDVVTVCMAYSSTPPDLNWNCHCDIAKPYDVIDIFDVVLITSNYGEEYLP